MRLAPREILFIHVGEAETSVLDDFLRGLVARGLVGAGLVISTHAGLSGDRQRSSACSWSAVADFLRELPATPAW